MLPVCSGGGWNSAAATSVGAGAAATVANVFGFALAAGAGGLTASAEGSAARNRRWPRPLVCAADQI
jgi:hypothetical protein